MIPAGVAPSPPTHVVEIRHDVRIRVRDGVELSANLFLPVPATEPGHVPVPEPEPAPASGPPGVRFPAILEMIPYRKDDWRYPSDVARGTYLATRGFALCRLDVRGTGSSGGVALDEYTEAETLDGYDVVEWLAGQPWCNGNVGMWGISYGGFTSIQVAALRPPHLRAIVPMYATDDRYTDDVHHIGGCATVSELSQYAVAQVAMNALPPRPAYVGPGWVDRWRERLEATPTWLFEWARQQRDGPYWRRGSLAPEYGRITAAILHIGGWMDGYVDPVLRMQERCVNAPRRSIIGNWVHALPDSAYPGPSIDWLRELVRFFDHWLKGIDNGVMDEPGLTYFRREYTTPEAFPTGLDGSWQAEPCLPVERLEERALYLSAGASGLTGPARDVSPLHGSLVAGPPDTPRADEFAHHPTTGTRASLSWGAGSPPNGLSRDLRPDEAWGPTYTSGPLDAPLDILGFPEAVLFVSVTAPVAHVVVRLADVAPDGASSQVSAGILNLTHRRTHVAPEPLECGRVYEVRVPLRAAGYRFLPGHRIRLSVASAYWPVIWPSPGQSVHTVHHGSTTPSRLVLPVLPSPSDAPVPAFGTSAPELIQVGSETADPPRWLITEDVIGSTVTVTTSDAGTTVLPDGTTLFTSEALEMTASERDPGDGRFANECVYHLCQDGADAEVTASGVTLASQDAFDMEVRLEVRLDGRPFFERIQREVIPRDLL
jgi:uncharacterized protein